MYEYQTLYIHITKAENVRLCFRFVFYLPKNKVKNIRINSKEMEPFLVNLWDSRFASTNTRRKRLFRMGHLPFCKKGQMKTLQKMFLIVFETKYVAMIGPSNCECPDYHISIGSLVHFSFSLSLHGG